MAHLKRLEIFSLLMITAQACSTSAFSTPEAASTSSAETAIAELTKATPAFTFTPTSTFTPTASSTFTPSPTVTPEAPNFLDEYFSWMFDQVQLDPLICSDTIIWEYVKDFAVIPEGYTVMLWNVTKTYEMGIGPPLCRMFAVSPPSPGVGQVLYVRKNYSPVTKDPAMVVMEIVYFDQRYVDNMIYFGADKRTPTPYGD